MSEFLSRSGTVHAIAGDRRGADPSGDAEPTPLDGDVVSD